MPTVSRVRPMAECYSWPDSLSDYRSLLPGSPHQVCSGTEWSVQVYRPRHEYYAVRRAFLTSYQFSTRESFRQRTARLMRELTVEAMTVLRGIPSRVSPRRLGCRLARALSWRRMMHHLPSSFSPVRCFTGRTTKGRGVV